MTGRRIAAIVAVVAVAGGATAAVLVGTNAFSSDKTTPTAAGHASSPAPSTSSSPQATPQSVAQAFLAAWSSGDYSGAAALTDDTATATTRLKTVMTTLAPKKLTLVLGDQENVPSDGASSPSSPSQSGSSGSPTSSAPSSAAGSAPSSSAAALARYQFNVSADFGNNLVWTYTSALNLVQGPAGTPVVHWSSAVINQNMNGSELLKAVSPPVSVVGSDGNPIDTTKHPTLSSAVKALSTHTPANTTPTQLTVEFVDANTDTKISGSQDWPLNAPGAAPASSATVKTSIDPKVQSAMEAALAGYKNSGMVAIQPSTGDILGMASNDGSALAYKAQRAPGSTFKVITTALALQKGLTINSSVNCSGPVTVEGLPISNDSDLANGIPGADLKDAFEASCNTAFVHLALDGKLGSDYSALANEAKTYFGMNQKWDLGMGQATYGTSGDQQVPPATGQGDFAREAFGQSTIEMSPLTMASVAATICNGSFKQPVLVPGTQPIATAQPLPAGIASQITTLMQGVINSSEGTAYYVFPHNLGLAAKSGSAEQAESAKPGGKTDSWMIVFDKKHDIAFGALVVDGGFGKDAAGPAIDKALASLGYI